MPEIAFENMTSNVSDCPGASVCNKLLLGLIVNPFGNVGGFNVRLAPPLLVTLNVLTICAFGTAVPKFVPS